VEYVIKPIHGKARGPGVSKGAHRLFRNVAKSMTGVSAVTASSTVESVPSE